MPRRRQTNTRPPGAPNGNGGEDPNYNHHQQPQQHQHNHHNPQRQHRPKHNNQHHQHEPVPASAMDPAAAAVVAYRNDTRSSLNLPVITRHVPNAKRIVCQAAYCTVYKISATSGQWDKPDIEGPLFVLELSNTTTTTGKYQIFIMNRKGICSLLIPLPRKPANLDTGNSELISILIDTATEEEEEEEREGDGKMKFDASDEKGKSVECFGLRIYSEEGTSTEGDRIRIGEELKGLVEGLKAEEEAERERVRIEEEEKVQQEQMEQQMEQQQQQQQQAAVMMGRSMSTYVDVGGSYREPGVVAGRRITLAELFGQGGGAGAGGVVMPGQMAGYAADDQFDDQPPGPVPMAYSYTHM